MIVVEYLTCNFFIHIPLEVIFYNMLNFIPRKVGDDTLKDDTKFVVHVFRSATDNLLSHDGLDYFCQVRLVEIIL